VREDTRKNVFLRFLEGLRAAHLIHVTCFLKQSNIGSCTMYKGISLPIYNKVFYLKAGLHDLVCYGIMKWH